MWEEPGQPCHIHFIQCTLLLVEKAGVTPVVTFRITAHKQERVQVRDPLWLWNPWGRTHEVQNRSNQWLHKMDICPIKIKKKKKKKKLVGDLPVTTSQPDRQVTHPSPRRTREEGLVEGPVTGKMTLSPPQRLAGSGLAMITNSRMMRMAVVGITL